VRSRGSRKQRFAGGSAQLLLPSTAASVTRTAWCAKSVWHPDGLVDRSVPVLQSVRADGSAIATVAGYGAHTVTTGVEFPGYSPDYVGPLRETVRGFTGGECVFIQGAAGNVMPLVGFDDDLRSPGQMGRRVALEALHAVADRPSWPVRLVQTGFGSATPLELFRFERVEGDEPALAALEAEVEFPLQPLPSLADIAVESEQAERALAEAEERGASESELRVLRFHGLNWARRTEAEIAGGNPRTSVSGSICAIRIGDVAIVTGPGEAFTEIGLAVNERSPVDVTFYAGYSNGCISYMPTAAEYPLGGYEPTYGHKTYRLPAQVASETERLLVETGVQLAVSLFPEREAPRVDGWLATGAHPAPPPTPPPARDALVTGSDPDTEMSRQPGPVQDRRIRSPTTLEKRNLRTQPLNLTSHSRNWV
jgi:neutral ceramidase